MNPRTSTRKDFGDEAVKKESDLEVQPMIAQCLHQRSTDSAVAIANRSECPQLVQFSIITQAVVSSFHFSKTRNGSPNGKLDICLARSARGQTGIL